MSRIHEVQFYKLELNNYLIFLFITAMLSNS